MPDWAGIILGVVILALVFSDRRDIGRAWRRPARFWRADEGFEARAPSQPGNALAGVILGLAAIAYGVYSLLLEHGAVPPPEYYRAGVHPGRTASPQSSNPAISHAAPKSSSPPPIPMRSRRLDTSCCR